MPRHNHYHEASLDVLTDGSETLEPAVFLTIRRYTDNQNIIHRRRRSHNYNDSDAADPQAELSQQQVEDGNRAHYECTHDIQEGSSSNDDADEGTIVSRYNLSGLPSLTGRLSSDQSFKLLQGGAFRTVLIPSLVGSFHDGTYGMRGACVGGLPALFLSLIQSGYKVAEPSTVSGGGNKRYKSRSGADSSDSAPEIIDDGTSHAKEIPGGYGDISIIGPPGIDATIDGILNTMFGNVRRRPSVRICEVPAASNWWEVYQDSYIKVWAQSVKYGLSSVSLCEGCKSIEKVQDSSSDDEPSSVSSSSGEDSDENIDGGCSSTKRRKVRGEANKSSDPAEYSVVYIVMLLTQKKESGKSTDEPANNNQNNEPFSFAIMPSTPSMSQSQKCQKCSIDFQTRQRDSAPYWETLRNLPQEIVSTKSRSDDHLLQFILHYDPDHGRAGNENCEQNSETSCKSHPKGSANSVEKSCRKKVPLHKIDVPPWSITSKLAAYHLATLPKNYNTGASLDDEGILIRARHRSQLLHNFLPFAFPRLTGIHTEQQNWMGSLEEYVGENVTSGNPRSVNSVMAFGLRSCTSVILHGGLNEGRAEQPFTFVLRIENIYNRCKDTTFSSWADMDKGQSTSAADEVNYAKIVQRLKCAFRGGSCYCNECGSRTSNAQSEVVDDDNEIDLDSSCSDCDDEHTGDNVKSKPFTDEFSAENAGCEHVPSNPGAIDVFSPHLLMLGTGCATPSPLRGSSGYSLFSPTASYGTASLVLSAIMDCGEGAFASLLQYLPAICRDDDAKGLALLDVQLSHVNFIWISHSHLDHYADLPIFVQAIIKAKMTSVQKHPCRLIVIAPRKVLNYLNVILNQSNASRMKNIEYLQLATHWELQHSPFARHIISSITEYALPMPICQDIQLNQSHNNPNQHYFPFASLRNVAVEHCRDSFALILEINVPSKDKTRDIMQSRFVLCFSGDTRPSVQLVKACQSCFPQRLNLLIHEGTFLPESQHDAVRKRHSTTLEALEIARSINAEACILTHFSQRYRHVSINNVCQNKDFYPFIWGVASDGMVIPLTKRALLCLNRLSQCIDALMTTESKSD